MADNFTAKDAGGSTITFDSDDIGAGVQAPRRVIREIMAGASVDIGAVADSAVMTDTTGSLSGKLRGLVKWAFERTPASLGQKTSANSFAVVIASDQTAIPLSAGSAAIGAVKDNGVFWTPSDFIVDSADASSVTDLSTAPTSGEKIVIDDLEISVGATAMTVTVKEETTGAVLYKLFMAANTTVVISPRNSRKLAGVDKKVQIQASVAGNIFAHLGYHSAA
jgi:hypothetical protein